MSKSGMSEKNEEIDWELRPGGMLVQRRDDEEDGADGGSGSMIRISVSHGPSQHEVLVPAESTFGDLKKVIARKTGLEPEDHKVLFRGEEKDDEENLQMVGVKDNSKVMVMEDPERRERRLEETKRRNAVIAKQCEAVAAVRGEIDKLSERVSVLEVAVEGGTRVADKEFDMSSELLMKQLLKLDGIEAEGEARLQRKAEVRRVQGYVDKLDALKARNSNPNPPSNDGNAVSITTQWETFDNGVGSLSAPPPKQSTANVEQDWERFD